MTEVSVVTIDGPSGSGKGTIGQLLARALGWHFLDSGAIYRALAWLVIINKVSINDVDSIVKLAFSLELKFLLGSDGKTLKIYLGSEAEDITLAIRSQQCAMMASRVAVIPQVRKSLVDYQRSFAIAPGLVADGRDMGTVIFPNALLKIFLIAEVSVRAKRRLLQLQTQGISASLEPVLADLIERDKRDSERSVAPLLESSDAMVIDTTKLSIDEVLQKLVTHVKDMLN